MSLPRRPSAGSRKRPAASGGPRHPHGDSSISSTYSGPRHPHGDSTISSTYSAACKGSDCSPHTRSHPATPRRQAKYATCSENHGIRPPAPEQYLTPLQQKEVCIRHLRSRLRENVERLQNRDSEIGDLRTQLTRMQEDWIEEECHRIEAQLALKEAKKEIRQLQQAVETVRTSLSARDLAGREEPEAAGRAGPRADSSRSCGCSPAHTLTRSATFTRMSSEASPGAERSGNLAGDGATPGSRGAPALRGDGRTHLLLEAALLSEQLLPPRSSTLPRTSTTPRSSTYERLCSGETMLPVSRPCHALNNSCSYGGHGGHGGHSYLPHHHLFLHLPQEEAPAPCPPPSEASDRPGFRSQACSPTITWISEELSVISTATGAADATLSEPQPFSPSSSAASPAQPSLLAEPLPPDSGMDATITTTTTTLIQQPARGPPPSEEHARQAAVSEAAEEVEEEDGCDEAGEEGAQGPPQRSHWSRYFLVDLLAVAVPVVPTVAWLCRGARRDGLPVYHMGSLLRGCCAVALHSLRRVGRARGRGPTGTGGATPI